MQAAFAVQPGISTVVAGLAGPTPTEAATLKASAGDRTAYTLPAATLAKAKALQGLEETLTVTGTLWTPAVILLLLTLGGVAAMRRVSVRWTTRRWMQTVVFLLLFLLALSALDTPLAAFGHWEGLRYGLSVQGWASWAADRAKSLALNFGIGTLLVLPLLWLIRRSPRRWWLWAWPAAMAVVLAGVLVTPYVIDPLFNRFEPLSRSDPALVVELERVVARSGITIPPERMFLMRASAKTTGLNAYVTGFGPSKRIVVWDTTIAHSTPEEIAFVFAHELGHYALEHVLTGVALSCLALLPLLGFAHLAASAMLKRWGGAWRITRMDDAAALPVLLLAVVLLSSATEPLDNAVSRRIEHNADVFGQEAMHTIVPDAEIGAIGRASFQVLGEASFDDPAPHPWFDAWFGSHPPIGERAAFALRYDPWAAGAAPKYFRR